MQATIDSIKYYYTGVQHTQNGEIGIPLVKYDSVDEYLAKYHQEMSYALANKNLYGLTTLVFDSTGVIVLQDHWMRGVEESESDISDVEEQGE